MKIDKQILTFGMCLIFMAGLVGYIPELTILGIASACYLFGCVISYDKLTGGV